jgi:sulfonate transport system ATP-binding protein
VPKAVTLADRVVIIENGKIALNVEIGLPRSRQRGTTEVAALEGRILEKLFAGAEAEVRT